ncbi:MAG: nucleotidyltransferase domain-containing protein [Nanoarchaeota archaeon]
MVNSRDVKKVTEEVLKSIKPDEKPLIIAQKFISRLNKLLLENNISAKAVLGGSMAKNTFLKNDFDADVFVKFDTKYKGRDISKLLKDILINNFEFEVVRGSRDYFHVFEKILFELIPVLDVSRIEDAENVIDMSPLHVEYFKRKGKGLEDEVRLLKQFMKANRVYGAESFVNGFSGHVVDLLVIKYGSFLNVLKASLKWSNIVVIDLERKLKDPLMELDKSKISGPLVIVDPVQDARNAAAALGFDCFNSFIKSAKSFLNAPTINFFEKESAYDIIIKKKRDEDLFEFLVEPLRGNDDIAGTKILKVLEFINNKLKFFDFTVSDFEWDFGRPSHAYFLIERGKLNPVKVVRGPPIRVKSHCDAFKSKHNDVFEKDGFLYANIKRDFVHAKDALKNIIEDEYVKSRVKNISFKLKT